MKVLVWMLSLVRRSLRYFHCTTRSRSFGDIIDSTLFSHLEQLMCLSYNWKKKVSLLDHKVCVTSLNAEVACGREVSKFRRKKTKKPCNLVLSRNEEQHVLIIKQFICQIRMPIQYIQYIRQSEYYQGKMLCEKTRVRWTSRLHGKWTIIVCIVTRSDIVRGSRPPRPPQQLNIHIDFYPIEKKHNSLYTDVCKIRLHIPTSPTTCHHHLNPSKQEGLCCFTSILEQYELGYFFWQLQHHSTHFLLILSLFSSTLATEMFSRLTFFPHLFPPVDAWKCVLCVFFCCCRFFPRPLMRWLRLLRRSEDRSIYNDG